MGQGMDIVVSVMQSDHSFHTIHTAAIYRQQSWTLQCVTL